MQQAPRGYDLLVAADVLIYLGDLFPVFSAAAACLRPGGQFAFSVEAGGGERFNLVQKSRRFTHARPYLEKLAAMHGFEQLAFNPIVARQENEKPVIGYLVVLRWPGP
jgi:predicted TPR repeat methyltransferase